MVGSAVSESFRVEGAAASVKNADDIPGAPAEVHWLTHFQTTVGGRDILADYQFSEARGEEATLDDVYIAAHFQRFGGDPANLDVGVGAGREQRERRDYDNLGTDHWLPAFTHHLRFILERAYLIERNRVRCWLRRGGSGHFQENPK
jgi:hypothetical protein